MSDDLKTVLCFLRKTIFDIVTVAQWGMKKCGNKSEGTILIKIATVMRTNLKKKLSLCFEFGLQHQGPKVGYHGYMQTNYAKFVSNCYIVSLIV